MTNLEKNAVTTLLKPSQALRQIKVEVLSRGSRSDPTWSTGNNRLNFLGLRFDHFGILIDEHLNKEVIGQFTIRKIPNSPTWLDGFSQINGVVTPVVNLHRLFDIAYEQDTAHDQSFLLVLNTGKSTFALPMTEEPEQLSFNSDETHALEHLAPRRLKPYIQCCYRDNITWFSIQFHEFLNHLKNCS